MKKPIIFFLVLSMMISSVACSGGKQTGDMQSSDMQTGDMQANDKPIIILKEPDLSKYPEHLHDWSAQQLLDYFLEAGVFLQSYQSKDHALIICSCVQDHESCYLGIPINECASCCTPDSDYFAGIYTVMKDDSEGSVEEFLDYIREHHETPRGMPVDHLADNVIFFYRFSQDQDFKDAMEVAYNRLITELGVTPDF